MQVGVLSLSFFLPAARSLKDKRRQIKSFKERIQTRFKVSVAEVASQDLHQRALLAVAVVSEKEQQCREVLDAVKRVATSHSELQFSAADIEIFKPF